MQAARQAVLGRCGPGLPGGNGGCGGSQRGERFQVLGRHGGSSTSEVAPRKAALQRPGEASGRPALEAPPPRAWLIFDPLLPGSTVAIMTTLHASKDPLPRGVSPTPSKIPVRCQRRPPFPTVRACAPDQENQDPRVRGAPGVNLVVTRNRSLQQCIPRRFVPFSPAPSLRE